MCVGSSHQTSSRSNRDLETCDKDERERQKKKEQRLQSFTRINFTLTPPHRTATHQTAQQHYNASVEPIHQAAYDGNEAEVVRLVQDDGRRLNAQIQA